MRRPWAAASNRCGGGTRASRGARAARQPPGHATNPALCRAVTSAECRHQGGHHAVAWAALLSRLASNPPIRLPCRLPPPRPASCRRGGRWCWARSPRRRRSGCCCSEVRPALALQPCAAPTVGAAPFERSGAGCLPAAQYASSDAQPRQCLAVLPPVTMRSTRAGLPSHPGAGRSAVQPRSSRAGTHWRCQQQQQQQRRQQQRTQRRRRRRQALGCDWAAAPHGPQRGDRGGAGASRQPSGAG